MQVLQSIATVSQCEHKLLRLLRHSDPQLQLAAVQLKQHPLCVRAKAVGGMVLELKAFLKLHKLKIHGKEDNLGASDS